jgi:radical SAM superfamily enzyme YgiQ (UPF0313 family)
MKSGRNDLLLVVPQNADTYDIVAGAHTVTAPLGVGYIAAYLRQKGCSVKIIDNNIEKMNDDAFSEYLKKNQPRYIGISILTTSYANAISMASVARKVIKDSVLIAGGAHASALPFELLRNSCFDIVVKGEGEETMADLISTMDAGKDLKEVQGIIYREQGGVKENEDREPIEDLDSLPMPAYDLLPMDKYFVASTRRLSSGKVGAIVTSRGCSYKCSFCSKAVFKQGVRYRNPSKVIEEIKHLTDEYGIKEFIVWDDTFTMNEAHAIAISEGIRKLGKKIYWSCYSRVEHASDRLYKILYQGGCRELSFGAESGSQSILDSICKNNRVEDITRAVECCKRNKLMSFCCFVLGFPGETADTINKTLDFAKKLNPDFVSFCLFTPLPGSKFFLDAVNQGLISTDNEDWSRYICLMSTMPPPVNLSEINDEELIKWQKKAFYTFYFRPRYVFSRLLKLRSMEALYQLWRGSRTILKFLKHETNS